MRPLGFVGPTFPPEVNERLQYEVLLPFMLHIIYDAFGRTADLHGYRANRPLAGYSHSVLRPLCTLDSGYSLTPKNMPNA